jgi:hypothetical protein
VRSLFAGSISISVSFLDFGLFSLKKQSLLPAYRRELGYVDPYVLTNDSFASNF